MAFVYGLWQIMCIMQLVNNPSCIMSSKSGSMRCLMNFLAQFDNVHVEFIIINHLHGKCNGNANRREWGEGRELGRGYGKLNAQRALISCLHINGMCVCCNSSLSVIPRCLI